MHEIQGNIIMGWKGDLIDAEEQSDISLHPQRAELPLEQRLFSQPIFYCQDLGEQAIRKCTCASLKCLFIFWERERGKWLIIHYKGYIVTQNFLLICLSLGTQIPLESAAQEQELLSERFPTFRKLHNDMHDSSYFQSFVELNFYIIFFEKSH